MIKDYSRCINSDILNDIENGTEIQNIKNKNKNLIIENEVLKLELSYYKTISNFIAFDVFLLGMIFIIGIIWLMWFFHSLSLVI